MSNIRRITWLKGDYVGNHERQAQAQSEGCKLVIEFHFNSNGPIATGGETWFKPGDPLSLTVATDIRNRYSNIGLSLHGPGPNAAVSGTRAGWLPFYSCSAILLEPLYVSNPDQARWIHQSGNVDLLAGQVTEAIFNNTSDVDVIGLSIGHRFKHSHPNDMGAACALGDNEADHGTALAEAVAAMLTSVAPVAAGNGTVPAPENPVLTSPLFQGNSVLEGVAEGHLVLQASGAKVNGIGPVQDALNTLGFPINLGSSNQFRGFFGEKTQTALLAFQQATPGILQPTGVVDEDSIKALDAALLTHGVAPEPPATPEDIKLLSKGKVVATLQEKPGGSGSLRSVNIMQLAGRLGFYYKAAMAIDVDGSPRAYTRDATSPKPLDSLESVDSEGTETMYIQQRSKTVRGVTHVGEGPFKDFFVSRTSLKFREDEAFKTSNFVDAELIPYIVFPHNQGEPAVFSGTSLGDVAYVIDLRTGRSTHAIFADTNPKVGEASLRVARNLGRSDLNAGNGEESDIFLYILFPGTRFDPEPTVPHWPDAEIKEVADKAFAAWGGMDQVRALFPTS